MITDDHSAPCSDSFCSATPLGSLRARATQWPGHVEEVMGDDAEATVSSLSERERIAASNADYRVFTERPRATAASGRAAPASPGISLPQGRLRGFRAQGRARKRKAPAESPGTLMTYFSKEQRLLMIGSHRGQLVMH